MVQAVIVPGVRLLHEDDGRAAESRLSRRP
jgi:hypothetical protein